MPKKKLHRIVDQFSNDEMEQIKRYGQALSGGVTPFDEEVERHLARYEANRKKMEVAKAQAAQSLHIFEVDRESPRRGKKG